MSAMTDRVTDEALSLPVDARLDLVGREAPRSLNLPTDEEIGRLWAEEAERRVAEVDSGEARLVPGEAVFHRIRAKHGR